MIRVPMLKVFWRAGFSLLSGVTPDREAQIDLLQRLLPAVSLIGNSSGSVAHRLSTRHTEFKHNRNRKRAHPVESWASFAALYLLMKSLYFHEIFRETNDPSYAGATCARRCGDLRRAEVRAAKSTVRDLRVGLRSQTAIHGQEIKLLAEHD